MATITAEAVSETLDTNKNPCVRNCCLDEKNVCLGCGRRLAEILEWHHADTDRKASIIQSARNRLLQRDALKP